MRLSPEAAAALKAVWPSIEKMLAASFPDRDMELYGGRTTSSRRERFNVDDIAAVTACEAAENWVNNGNGPPGPYIRAAVRKAVFTAAKDRSTEDRETVSLDRPYVVPVPVRGVKGAVVEYRAAPTPAEMHTDPSTDGDEPPADPSSAVADLLEAAFDAGAVSERQVAALWASAGLGGDGSAISYADLGDKLGISRQAAATLHKRALTSLRAYLAGETLDRPETDGYTPRPVPTKNRS